VTEAASPPRQPAQEVGVRCELALKVALGDDAGHDVGDLELRVSGP
jgi:hypothetical protein